MSEERKKILNMVAEGKVTPEEGEKLLAALRDDTIKGRFFKVRVYEQNKEKPKVKVDIPLGVLKLLLKLGAVAKNFVPDNFKMNLKGKELALDGLTPEMIDEILNEIGEGGKYTLVEVDDTEKNEHVEVFIE